MTEERMGMNINGNGYEIWWDDEHGIARGRVLGILTLELAEGIHRNQNMIIEKYGDGRSWLIDLTEMKKAESDARREIVDLSSDPRLDRQAFYGASVFARTVVNFMMTAAHKTNVKHCKTELEGLQWLKGGANNDKE